ncbi:MAG: hypothetical protein CXT73_04850 [Methanobacteriota archaeon]|nr:MAG: hypothetical protein CXT73_04850 [Euryarchaeota archaeon]
MGNTASTLNKEPKDKDDIFKNEKLKLPNVLHHIAAKYITQMNFKDMENLHQPEKCNNIVVLTSKVLQRHLNELEISYLDLSVRGSTPDEFSENMKHNQQIAYLAKNNLNAMDVPSKRRKQRMCNGISRYYVRVAHLFAAINLACNPHIQYIDIAGNKQVIPIMKKDTIPKGVQTTLTKLNFCTKRVSALKPVQNTDNRIVIKGKNCNMNKKSVPVIGGANEEIEQHIPVQEAYDDTKNFNDEIGIPELENLYYDVFDFKTGKFYDMSKKSKEQYNKDLLTFYTIFAAKKKMPKEIKKFADIKLRDFHNQELCKDPESPWIQSYTAKASNKLFKVYAKHVSDMIAKNNENEKALLTIIEKIFSYWIENGVKKVTLNPKLTYDELDKLIPDARNKIIKLYIDCEKDFQTGLNLLEAIVKDRIIKNTKLKIQNFKEKSEELIIDKPIDKIVKHVNIQTLSKQPMPVAAIAAGGFKY